jgi:nucleoid DNA-binding protein
MSLQRIAKQLAGEYGMPEETIQRIARDVLVHVERAVLETGSCVVRGFGSFRLQRRAPRPARNPRTGEPVLVPARDRIVFAQGADRIRAMESAQLETPSLEPTKETVR